jgi:hypothetical protein
MPRALESLLKLPPKFVELDAAPHVFGISRRRLGDRQWRVKHRFPFTYAGGKLVFDVERVTAWFRQRARNGRGSAR